MMPTHGGEVSFPGGHTHDHESPEDCALRETTEEVQGLGNIRILGKLQQVPASKNCTIDASYDTH